MTLTLRHGVFMAPFHALEEDPTICIHRDLELCEWLDRLGFDEAWIGEHHSAGFETIGAPELFIAHAAAITTRLWFGTGVVVQFRQVSAGRRPFRTASTMSGASSVSHSILPR